MSIGNDPSSESVHPPYEVGTEHHAFLSRLNYLLEKKRMSRRALATGVGISSAAMSAYWGRQSEPGRPVLVGIADTMGVHLLWLITGEGPIWRDSPPPGVREPSTERPPLVSFDTSALTIAMRHLEHLEREAGRSFDPEGRAAAIAGLYLALMRNREKGMPDPQDPK